MSRIDDRPATLSRRHRAAILATAASLLSMTIAATTSAVLITRARRETMQALDAATNAVAAQRLATEEKAAALAAQSRAIAEALAALTRATAEKQVALDAETKAKDQMRIVFSKALKTVEDFVTLIHDDRQFRETPALHPLREALLKRALAFSQDFVRNP